MAGRKEKTFGYTFPFEGNEIVVSYQFASQ